MLLSLCQVVVGFRQDFCYFENLCGCFFDIRQAYSIFGRDARFNGNSDDKIWCFPYGVEEDIVSDVPTGAVRDRTSTLDNGEISIHIDTVNVFFLVD